MADLKFLELKANRSMLDPSFEGYKLTLREMTSFKHNLSTKIDLSHLSSEQYGLLHAKLFGLHNYLFVDPFEAKENVYFIDKNLNVLKTYVDSLNNELINPVKVWTVPKIRERIAGDYNVSLGFASSNIVTISDGLGTVYVLETRDKSLDNEFILLYSGEVLGKGDQGFLISDAKYSSESKILQILLIHIEEDPKDRFVSIIHCITLKNDGEKWNQTALKQLKTKGEVEYLYLGEDLDSLNIVTNNELQFTLDSDNEIKELAGDAQNQKTYTWSQTMEDINLKIQLLDNSNKNLIKVHTTAQKIEVTYDKELILEGNFAASVDPSLTNWTLNNRRCLEVTLIKTDKTAALWPTLLSGDQNGQYQLEPAIIESVNDRLSDLTSDTESLPQAGTTFNSAPVEECDFESDKSSTFERIQISACKRTHKIRLGSHSVLLTAKMAEYLSPAIGIRNDVDICLWQPKNEGDNFEVEHVGTLLAIGYVQASKQNRTFTVCSPDLSYCAISDSTGHIFVYKQNHPVIGSHLRNRTSGERIKTLAQQQVINLANQQILGIYAGPTYMFVLGEDFVMALQVNE